MTPAIIINLAKSFVGNTGEKFWKAYGFKERVAWCCIFVWYLFNTSGAAILFYDGKKTAYVPTLWKAAKDAGLTSDVPKAGDLVVYDWNGNNIPDHVGLVVSITNSHIHTIEGNVDDRVKELDRPRNNTIMGYVHPAYTSDCSNCPLKQALTELYNLIKEA